MECAVDRMRDRVRLIRVVQTPHGPSQLKNGVEPLVRIITLEVHVLGNLDPCCDESCIRSLAIYAGTSIEPIPALLRNYTVDMACEMDMLLNH